MWQITESKSLVQMEISSENLANKGMEMANLIIQKVLQLTLLEILLFVIMVITESKSLIQMENSSKNLAKKGMEMVNFLVQQVFQLTLMGILLFVIEAITEFKFLVKNKQEYYMRFNFLLSIKDLQ